MSDTARVTAEFFQRKSLGFLIKATFYENVCPFVIPFKDLGEIQEGVWQSKSFLVSS